MTGDTDHDLDAHSLNLMHALDEMKRMEGEKRGTERSTEGFHELADEVERKSREVWQLAEEERIRGQGESPLAEDRQVSGPGDWTRDSDA